MLRNFRWYTVWIMIIGMLGVVACTQVPSMQPESETDPRQIVTVEVTRVVPVTVEVTRVVSVTVEVTRVVPVTVEVTPVATQVVIPTPPIIEPTPVLSGELGALSGKYAWDGGNSAGCTLQITHWNTLEPFQPADFTLFCCRGAPSYNIGEMSGRMTIDRDMGVYTYSDKAGLSEEPCHLVFMFAPETVEVRQLGMDFDCGFGFGVYASGVYTRTD